MHGPRKRDRRSAAKDAETTPSTPLALPAPRPLLVLILLSALAVIAYLPAMRGELIWDDEAHVTKPELRSFSGLRRIWFEIGATQQYYPLLHSAFWLEHRIWGDSTLGYHLANVAQHALAAFLAYVILLRLKIPGALFAAAIFTVHPIEVESVAWISEQKNTFSAIFYFGSLLTYLRYERERGGIARTARHLTSWYVLSFALFTCGLLTKTVVASLPAAILVIAWWQRGTIAWRDVRPLVPFFIAGAALGLTTVWMERKFIGAEGTAFSLTAAERFLIAGRAVWFYLGKLMWPFNLVFIYPRWKLDAFAWWQWIFPAAAMVVTIAFWTIRHRWRSPLAGWLFFTGTLFPALGFLNVYPFLFSFVADHFQYLAGLGIIVPVAAWITLAARCLPPRCAWIGNGVMAALILGLATLSMLQSAMYGNTVALYETTLARNPECWMAHNNLGAYLASHNRDDEAVPHFRAALRLRPRYPEALLNLGIHLAKNGDFPAAIEKYEQALAIQTDYAEAQLNWGNALVQLKQLPAAIEHYEAAAQLDPHAAMPQYNLANALRNLGDTTAAIEHYKQATELDANLFEAQYNMALVLAKSGRIADAVDHFKSAIALRPEYAESHRGLGLALVALRRDAEAAEEFERTLQFAPDDFQAQRDLAATFARLHRPTDAIQAAHKALDSAKAAGHTELAQEIESWLSNFQNESPQ